MLDSIKSFFINPDLFIRHLALSITLFVIIVIYGCFIMFLRILANDKEYINQEANEKINQIKSTSKISINATFMKNNFTIYYEYSKIFCNFIKFLFLILLTYIGLDYFYYAKYVYSYTRYWNLHGSFLAYFLPFLAYCFTILLTSNIRKKLKFIKENNFFIIEDENKFFIDVLVVIKQNIAQDNNFYKARIEIDKNDILFKYKSFQPIFSTSVAFYTDKVIQANEQNKDMLIEFILGILKNTFRVATNLIIYIMQDFKIYTIYQTKNMVFSVPYNDQKAKFSLKVFFRKNINETLEYIVDKNKHYELDKDYIKKQQNK
ncbi:MULTISPECIES: hypothetical protein [unclassified Campylobacter]|uniref:hypothetical protein n=1 Tax=unclassified Campylobacter TaxID=2593542 RepID=UPI001BDA0BDD|nr:MULTISPECIES: hypothetical protein [unclassified Campylobacter]MBT0881354.1 hypothetical protein [Campylobacter sp. 2018MI27]MBT0884278.1 hypothetical protein [Campylobacter sp. 2018MI10]